MSHEEPIENITAIDVLKTRYTDVTTPIGMQCQLISYPEDLLSNLDFFQVILDDIDPVEFLPLQNYLQSIILSIRTRMRQGKDVTLEFVKEIILSSDTENSSRKRKRTKPLRKISELNKSDLLPYVRSFPPRYTNGEPYTYTQISEMTLEEIKEYILLTFPTEFC